MFIPDPSKKDFRVADLSLPKSVSEKAVESRQEFLKVVDRRYRSLMSSGEARAKVGSAIARAIEMHFARQLASR